MDPTNFFGKNIMDVLQDVRSNGSVAQYSKIEGDEFLKFPEDGYYLHAKNGDGVISNCRIYFESRDQYLPAKLTTRGAFAELRTVHDFTLMLGPPKKDIRAIQIPGAEPTFPGKVFEWMCKKNFSIQ